MPIDFILDLLQVLTAVLLVGAILIQVQGTGLGSAFGNIGGSYHTKRGMEKMIFYTTIALAATFLIVSYLNFKL